MKKNCTPVSLEEMRALQLGLIDAFDRHCRDSGLRYYIWAGTLLGALRHGGYIPWDDDIDLTMPRADYERLRCGFPGSALAGRFRLHHFATDPVYPNIITKLCDPRALVLGDTPAPIGVNIDIFPLDRWPASRVGSVGAKLGLWVLFKLRELSTGRLYLPEWKGWKKVPLHALAPVGRRLSERTVARWIDRYLQLPGGRRVTVGTHYIGPMPKLDREAYGEPSWLTFEGRTLPAPADPGAVLTHLYGNWRVPPPSGKRLGHRRNAVVWADPQTVAALDAMDPPARALVRDIAGLETVARRASGPGPCSVATPVSEPESR